MTFDPSLPTIVDEIRFALGDTSNDPATEIVPDQTYYALLDKYDDWREAAIQIGGAMLAALEQDVKSYSAQGDFSVTFRDPQRIREQIAQWQAELEAEAYAGAGATVSMTADVMTGTPGADEW